MMQEYDRLIHSDPQHQDVLWINWSMTSITDLDASQRFIDSLIEWQSTTLGKHIYVEIACDDTTISDTTIAVTKYLSERDVRVGIYAPTPIPTDTWDKLKPNVDQACLVYHYDNDTNAFISLVNSISDKIDVHVNMTFQNDQLDAAMRGARDVSKNAEEITINLFSHEGQTIALSTEDIDRLAGANAQIKRYTVANRVRSRKSHRGSMTMVTGSTHAVASPRELITNGDNQFNGWSCNAGVEQMVIANDGTIYRGWCKQGGPIGNITDQFITFPISSLTCGKSECMNMIDLMCSKSWH